MASPVPRALRPPPERGRNHAPPFRGTAQRVHMRIGSRLKPLHKGEKLAVLMPGMGAVATTAIAGVAAVKAKLAAPVGSLTSASSATPGCHAPC